MTPSPDAADAARLTSARIFVRDLVIQAEIGVHAHEYGRRQPLVIEAEIEIAPGPFAAIADTINYEIVAELAREIVASGHLKLVETFAERMAQALMLDARVLAVRVRVDKPEALAPAVAGVEVRASRT